MRGAHCNRALGIWRDTRGTIYVQHYTRHELYVRHYTGHYVCARSWMKLKREGGACILVHTAYYIILLYCIIIVRERLYSCINGLWCGPSLPEVVMGRLLALVVLA